jgi:hypothetical protein
VPSFSNKRGNIHPNLVGGNRNFPEIRFYQPWKFAHAPSNWIEASSDVKIWCVRQDLNLQPSDPK